MKPMLTDESSLRSSVLPDSVLVWKRRSKPLPSYVIVSKTLAVNLRHTYLGGKSHSAAGKQVAITRVGGEQAELGLVDESEEVLDLLLQRNFILVLRSVGVSGLGAGIGVAEGRHGECLWCSCESGLEGGL